MGKVLIVGEAPGRGGGHVLAGRCGALLCAAAGLGSYAELVRAARLENLLAFYPGREGRGAAFPRATAAVAARRVLVNLEPASTIVMLGHRVAGAFGVRADYFAWVRLGSSRAAVFPHPSGLNRYWNVPENRRRASVFLRGVLSASAA